MIRTNTFDVAPQTETDEKLLQRFLDASASLWNEVNYARRQRFFKDECVWNTDGFYEQYVGVLGGATTQTVIRRNGDAWNSFFTLLTDSDENPSPPGYWGNEADGRDLRTYVRKDAYTIHWDNRSRLEIRIGQDLKKKHNMGYYERLQLKIRGQPHWKGESGRLSITYDEVDEVFKGQQSVTVPDDEQESPRADHTAALDLGANILVACTTSTGQQFLYEGEDLFEEYRATSEEIADARAKLPADCESSRRIRRLYRTRKRRRNHAFAALARDLLDRLYDHGVTTVYVGDLSGGFDAKQAPEVNEKVHNFWAFGQFTDRLACVCEEYGMKLRTRSEAGTSQTCPDCGRQETTTRHGNQLSCHCGFDGHADLSAAWNFLARFVDTAEVDRSMARPVRFQWDNHEWRSTTDAQQKPNE